MSTIYKRGNIYYYEAPGHSPKSTRTSNPTEAKMLQNKWDREAFFSRNGFVDRERSWGEFRDTYLVYFKSVSAYSSLVKLKISIGHFERILAIDERTKVFDINRSLAEKWQIARLQEVAPNTVRTEKGYLSGMFNYALIQRLIDVNPFFKLKNLFFSPPEAPSYSHEEACRFLETITKDYPSFKGIALFAYWTGMRLEEILHQKASDVNIAAKVIRVSKHLKTCPCRRCDEAEKKAGTRGWAPKSKKERVIPIPAAVLPILKEITFQGKEELIFPFPSRTVSDVFARMHVRAGSIGKRHRLHIFRHTLASDMERAGIRDSVRRAILGHSAADVTGGYTHAFLEELHSGMKQLEQWRAEEHKKMLKKQ